MGDDKKKKLANLTTFMLSQDYLPEHWNWSNSEKKSLSFFDTTAQTIFDRLISNGLIVKEAYAISHDKDEHEIWNEYQNQYITSFTSNHIHFVAKLTDGVPLDRIAEIIGVEPNFIEKPRPGRYSYDNMLSYLIHIKYPQKYQYDPHSVKDLAGKRYIEYFRENHRQWMRGRAEKIIQDAVITFKELKVMISEGRVTREDVLLKPEYNFVYHDHMEAIDDFFDRHDKIMKNRERINDPEFRKMWLRLPDEE